MRDLTKVLSDAEAVKLRALLAQTPDIPVDEHFGEEYPKMLFHADYLPLYRLIKEHPDPLVKKEAQAKMGRVIVVVHTIEDEEEYLSDGWKTQPAELMVAAGEVDPRIPTGREGRRAGKMRDADREHELRTLRRRYAELTGKKFVDDEPTPVQVAAAAKAAAPAKKATAPAAPSSKREKVAAAARRASGGGHSAHA